MPILVWVTVDAADGLPVSEGGEFLGRANGYGTTPGPSEYADLGVSLLRCAFPVEGHGRTRMVFFRRSFPGPRCL